MKFMKFNLPKIEEEVLKFWKEKNVFEETLKKRKKRPNFVFYEGPPTANGLPGIHHVLSRVFKDIICRYKTMKGYLVKRKGGWDTHGLPVELEAEKSIGIKTKKDIEKYGINNFNKKCKESVWRYKKEWENLTERIGFWLDLKNPYITYENSYLETLFYIIKQFWKKGYLYQEGQIVPWCSRCQTSLSFHEVALGYKKIKEPAIYIKFKIQNSKFETSSLSPTPFSKTFLLVWTTTPWTLPGNVAIAINENFIYCKFRNPDFPNEYFIIAKERLNLLNENYEIIEEFKGKELVGLKYQPLYNNEGVQEEKIYQVLHADFVSLEEGTGLVHIAPAFGEEDYQLIKRLNIQCQKSNKKKFPILITVNEEGKMKTEGYKWNSIFVKNADPLIIEDLKTRNLIFKEELYEHDYPFCWRCDTPLLYYFHSSWFVKAEKIKKELIKNNQEINWIPSHLKEGRFGKFLEEVRDWNFSRERYWGTPLPIWKCVNCKKIEIIGSREDLRKQKFSSNRYFLLRHGLAFHNILGKIDSNLSKNTSLTRIGKIQVKKAAKKLKKMLKGENLDLIFCSEFSRCRETAEIIAKEINFQGEITTDKRINEMNFGIWNDKFLLKFRREVLKFPEKLFYQSLEKGENWTDLLKRASEFINEIEKKYQEKKILIVSHGDPLWFLMSLMEGLEKKEMINFSTLEKYFFVKKGEIKEMVYRKFPYNENIDLDFHRPYIDEIEFFCPYCQGKMKRIKEVCDVWFDSGAMPFAQAHWPFAWSKIKNIESVKYQIQNYIKKGYLFPADYICEGVDQTRGWFYTLLVVSTLLGFSSPYKNVISLGHVLDEKGEKMSKSKGNVVDPWQVIEKYGIDATRWYFFTINQPGDAKLFSLKDIENSLKRFIFIFWNCFNFFNTYAFKKNRKPLRIKNLLNQWVLSRLNNLISEVGKDLDKYEIVSAARKIENFLIDDISHWYIRRVRSVFQKETKEKKEFSYILKEVILNLTKITAPFIPFLSEKIWTEFKKRSVHLEDWPKVNKKLIKKELEDKMERIREIVKLVLKERKEREIKVRQPLALLKIKDWKLKADKELLELLKEEVNIKKIIFDSKIKKEIELDLRITPELKEEGIVRELIRSIQEIRKEMGYTPSHFISLNYSSSPYLKEIIEKNKDFILESIKGKSLNYWEEKLEFKTKKVIQIENEKIELFL